MNFVRSIFKCGCPLPPGNYKVRPPASIDAFCNTCSEKIKELGFRNLHHNFNLAIADVHQRRRAVEMEMQQQRTRGVVDLGGELRRKQLAMESELRELNWKWEDQRQRAVDECERHRIVVNQYLAPGPRGGLSSLW